MAKCLFQRFAHRHFYLSSRLLRPAIIPNTYFSSEPDTDRAGRGEHHRVKKPRVKSFAVKTYSGFIDRYVQKFEKRFDEKYPKAFKIYFLFKNGVSLFFQDFKVYYQVSSGLWYGGKSLDDFTYHQLQVYRQMPSDMLRVAPVLLISMLPFANYVIFPVAYMFPRHLLCRHFWLPEQQVEFSRHYLEHRRQHHARIRKFLVRESDKVKESSVRETLQQLLQQNHREDLFTEAGSEPVERLLTCRDVFEKRLSVERLYSRHRIHMQWHVAGCWGFPGRRSRLIEQAMLLLQTDRALQSLGVEKLTHSQLQQACFYRGVDASSPSVQQMTHFLNNWLKLSTQLHSGNVSLLLHAPALLGLERTVWKQKS